MWVATLAWLVTGFLVFTIAIVRPMRDKGVPKPTGFHPPAFIGSQSRELTAYRVKRRHKGESIAWWRFMIAWRVIFALLAGASVLVTFVAAFELF